MGYALAQMIGIVEQIIVLLVIVSVILSYFMSPYHPVRETLDRLVEPMLRPIRRLLPALGGFDFSPLVLIILVQLIGTVLQSMFISLF
ncbi:MAG: YggT family protein [Anaerolineales bacterium]